jgi:hypothetical protein
MLVIVSVLTLNGCTATEEADTVTALQSALTNLVQNRSLTEQFVRDVKSNTDAGDPAYVEAMESYQDARDVYNRYLDSVENGTHNGGERSLHQASPRDVENVTADFLAEATRALKPSVDTRRIAFQRAVVVPENLQTTLSKLPKKARERVIDQFDDQVRWRSWSQM